MEIKNILKLLIENQDKKFTIRKISKLRKINYKSAYNAIQKLEKQGIILAVREIYEKKIVRVSPHFFNTESQILKVVEAIKKL